MLEKRSNYVRLSFVVLVAYLFLLGSPLRTNCQEIPITRLSGKSTNGLTIDVWVDREVVSIDESLRVYVQVVNNNSKSVYLVRASKPEIEWKSGELLIQAPLPLPITHGGYDYKFDAIRPGATVEFNFEIPPSTVSEVGLTKIFVGLGFVNDISGIARKLNPGEDPV